MYNQIGYQKYKKIQQVGVNHLTFYRRINMEKKWYKEMSVYQIWPRSFCDGNGDGIGDLKGIIAKLDYIKDLGVDAIWFSPLYPSPNADYGYDIADYRDISEDYGTLDEFKVLIKELQSLCLDVKVLTEEDQEIEVKESIDIDDDAKEFELDVIDNLHEVEESSIVEEIDAFDSDEDEDDMDDIEFEDDVVYEDLNYDEEDFDM